MPGVPNRVSLRGLKRPLPLAGGVERWPPEEEEDEGGVAGLEGGDGWDELGAEPAPRSWMGEAVVVDDSSAEVERRRLSAVEGSERTRGRGANAKVDMLRKGDEWRVWIEGRVACTDRGLASSERVWSLKERGVTEANEGGEGRRRTGRLDDVG